MTLTPRARESTDGLARALDNDHLLVLRLRGRRRRCGPSIGSRDRPGYPSRSGRRHRKRRAATRGSGGRGTAPERRPGPHTQVEARQETPAARAGRVGPVRARRPDVAAVEADPRVSGRSPGCRYRARPAVGEPKPDPTAQRRRTAAAGRPPAVPSSRPRARPAGRSRATGRLGRRRVRNGRIALGVLQRFPDQETANVGRTAGQLRNTSRK